MLKNPKIQRVLGFLTQFDKIQWFSRRKLISKSVLGFIKAAETNWKPWQKKEWRQAKRWGFQSSSARPGFTSGSIHFRCNFSVTQLNSVHLYLYSTKTQQSYLKTLYIKLILYFQIWIYRQINILNEVQIVFQFTLIHYNSCIIQFIHIHNPIYNLVHSKLTPR